jgi:uncharacterized protein YbaR (Trm112 family)
MPKASTTDRPSRRGPSALEMFTDRVSEQELLSRLLAPYRDGDEPNRAEFLTTFYGVGGVGKTTLCNLVFKACRDRHPEVKVVSLNLDLGKWTPDVCFAYFIAALLPKLSDQKIPCPLTHTLLLMYSQADTGVSLPEGAAGPWTGAISVLDQATQAVGIPGIALVIQGAQWLRDRKRQEDTTKRLDELGLRPVDVDGKIDLLDLEDKLATALYEDLKSWAVLGGCLRIVLDGFERIQGRERRRDCQMLIQSFAGCIAVSPIHQLKARIRIIVFGRERLRWDEIYDDLGWNEFWTQHLLAGLGEEDAKDFLTKNANWLRTNGDPVLADKMLSYTNAILDAADEGVGDQRLISPYYIDLAVKLVCDSACEGRNPDLGKTPDELQDRFFRYLPGQEMRLLQILALAEAFDAPMFDALVGDLRVTGYAVGTFESSVVVGRSYVAKGGPETFRFYRLMEKSLQEQWMRCAVTKKEGREVVIWLLTHLESRIAHKNREYWGEEEIKTWRRGVAILITQGYERKIITLKECQELLESSPWDIYSLSLPVLFDELLVFHGRIKCIEFFPDNAIALQSKKIIRALLFLRMLGLNGFNGDFAMLEEEVEKVVASLTDREQKIIRQRFLLDNKCFMSLEELAQQFEVTTERIIQIQAKALRKMRHPTRMKKLAGFLYCEDHGSSYQKKERMPNLLDDEISGSLADLISGLDD